MVSSSKIKSDIEVGGLYEQWFSNEFLNDVEYNVGNLKQLKKYDILSEGITYEIKNDKQCFVYYRFGFEISSRGKLSGIHTTESDYWVTLVPVFNRVFIMNVESLKKFIKEHANESIIRKCGDDYSSKMILWDWDYFLKNIVKYDDIKIIKVSIPNLYGKNESLKLRNDFLKYYDRKERQSRCFDNERMNIYYNKLYKKLIS